MGIIGALGPLGAVVGRTDKCRENGERKLFS
jgi:hypothetical protein